MQFRLSEAVVSAWTLRGLVCPVALSRCTGKDCRLSSLKLKHKRRDLSFERWLVCAQSVPCGKSEAPLLGCNTVGRWRPGSEWRSGLTLPIQSEDLKVSFISGRDVIPTFCVHQVEMDDTSRLYCCRTCTFGRSDHTSLM